MTAGTGTTTDAGTSACGGSGGGGIWWMLIIFGLMFGVMYLTSIRPQKKRQQEEQKLRDSVQIGDDITTIGGINGRIVTVKEDSIVIETGADKTRMKLMRWAIQTNNTASERLAQEKAALDAAKAQEKEEKKASKRRSKKSDIDETE
ncbi:MAG: preprotein translocase subunit YajC [Clostridia bacterium]|nr:preprotein translocase subunit YajC [Clostridia bacterium]